MWANQTVQVCIPHSHKNEPVRDQGHFLYIRGLPFCLEGAHFWFPLEAVFLRFGTLHLNEVSPFSAAQIGDSWWHWISGSNLLLTMLLFCQMKELIVEKWLLPHNW